MIFTMLISINWAIMQETISLICKFQANTSILTMHNNVCLFCHCCYTGDVLGFTLVNVSPRWPTGSLYIGDDECSTSFSFTHNDVTAVQYLDPGYVWCWSTSCCTVKCEGFPFFDGLAWRQGVGEFWWDYGNKARGKVDNRLTAIQALLNYITPRPPK